MAKITRAISIRQPHVEAILRGRKKIEYRSGPTNIRERVYLYASLAQEERQVWEEYRIANADLPRGLIVGSVEIAGCTKSREYRGLYEYELVSPRRLTRHLTPTNQPQPRFWIPRFR